MKDSPVFFRWQFCSFLSYSKCIRDSGLCARQKVKHNCSLLLNSQTYLGVLSHSLANPGCLQAEELLINVEHFLFYSNFFPSLACRNLFRQRMTVSSRVRGRKTQNKQTNKTPQNCSCHLFSYSHSSLKIMLGMNILQVC